MKECPKCQTIKELSEFYNKKSSKDGKSSWCKPCTNARPHNPEVHRRAKLKAIYGITPEEYTSLLESQGGVCAICKQYRPHKGDSMCVDHCHATGSVRGILCGDCNRAIGLLKDNPTFLKNAINYLGG